MRVVRQERPNAADGDKAELGVQASLVVRSLECLSAVDIVWRNQLDTEAKQSIGVLAPSARSVV